MTFPPVHVHSIQCAIHTMKQDLHMFDHTAKLSFRATVNGFYPFVKARHPFETSFTISPFECPRKHTYIQTNWRGWIIFLFTWLPLHIPRIQIKWTIAFDDFISLFSFLHVARAEEAHLEIVWRGAKTCQWRFSRVFSQFSTDKKE